jgi:hypothetical protein
MDYQIVNMPGMHHERFQGDIPYKEMTAIQVQAIYSKLTNYITLSDEQRNYLDVLDGKSISYISGDMTYFRDRLQNAKDWSTAHKILSLYVTASLIAGLPLAVLGMVEVAKNLDNSTAFGLWLTLYMISGVSFFMSGMFGIVGYKTLEFGDQCRDQHPDLEWKDLLISVRAPSIAFNREEILQAKLNDAIGEFDTRMDAAIAFYRSADPLLRKAIIYYTADILKQRYEETYKLIGVQGQPQLERQAPVALDFALLETLAQEGQLRKNLQQYDVVMLSILENLDEAKANAYLQS